MASLFDRLARPIQTSPQNTWFTGLAMGARVATGRGECPVEALRIGESVLTRDSGLQRIIAINHELCETRTTRAVLIRKGALGHDLPERDMTVSATHRVLVVSGQMRLFFDVDEAFVAAGDLVGRHGVEWTDAPAAGWLSISLASHEIILTEGTWSETEPLRLAGGQPVTGRRVLKRFEAQLLS
ncbi:Hint domain-containing protein [Palleronia abyssalis]|uniref:Hedgehog/Intein (Hint) domain-containing protein n=1 Tax=Palleronia abyssalis TaxID=1501240 RepID=A0A2R8BQ55_9RHOB|nr:Hint domain-containing protein [Palleronia abyssalis]SPJ22299.1 hypothetical protein PAA8504_00089 [Palleronia abyssalis]